MTVRLDRVQALCMAMVGAATSATPLWAPAQDFARSIAPGVDVVTAKLVRGPFIRGTRKDYSAEPTALRWTVTTPTDNARLVLALTGARFVFDTPPGSNAAQVRDGVLALFSNAEFLPGVTVAAFGPASIDFTAAAPGLLWGHRTSGPGHAFAVTTAVDCEIETANAECVVEFQAYGARDVDAHTLLGRIGGALAGDDQLELRERWGVTVRGPLGEPFDLTALAGPRWESRAAARLPVAVRSYRAIPIHTIGTVEMTLQNDTAATAEIEVTL